MAMPSDSSCQLVAVMQYETMVHTSSIFPACLSRGNVSVAEAGKLFQVYIMLREKCGKTPKILSKSPVEWERSRKR